MSTAPPGKWSPEQQRRLNAFQAPRSVDVHCHCLPGLDDGPATMSEALALCEALVADGVTTVMATPHQLGRYDRLNPAGQVRDAVAGLTAALAEHGIPLEVLPGGDVRVDERLPRLLDTGDVATLGDKGRHLLLELPHEILVNPVPMIEILRERGIQAVLTHPERYHYLHGGIDYAPEWTAQGAVLQITAGSLLGDFGGRVREHAWRLVAAGLVGIVATDAHDTHHRPPRLTAAFEALTQRIGPSAAATLLGANPLRVLQGQFIQPPTSG